MSFFGSFAPSKIVYFDAEGYRVTQAYDFSIKSDTVNKRSSKRLYLESRERYPFLVMNFSCQDGGEVREKM